jgi:tetratricopeptide (TPR) repeat protein
MRAWLKMATAALALAGAGVTAGQPPYSQAEQAALALLARAPRANPTEVTVAAARAAVRARPRDADAWHQLGESLEVAGDLPGAVRAFERATRLPPRVIGRAYLHRDLAEARERAGDLPGAIAAARVSVRSWPLSRDGLTCTSHEALILVRLLVAAHDAPGARTFYAPLADPGRANWCRVIRGALGAIGREES